MDVESLEKENERGLDALSERLGLLKQVNSGGSRWQTAQPRHLQRMNGTSVACHVCNVHLAAPNRLVSHSPCAGNCHFGESLNQCGCVCCMQATHGIRNEVESQHHVLDRMVSRSTSWQLS